MKLCSRLLVLYCRNWQKDDKFRYLIPILRKLGAGSIEPWLMAPWKARVNFLLTVTELLFLSLTVDALHGKTCQNSLLFGEGGSVWAKISGKGVVPGEHFLVSTKLDTFCYLTVQTAPWYVQSFWHNTGVWQTNRQTDGQTDGIAIHRVSEKNCANFFLSELREISTNFDNFSTSLAKRPNLSEMHSISTSSNSRHHTTVLNADVPNCYTMLKVVIFNKLSSDLISTQQTKIWFI